MAAVTVLEHGKQQCSEAAMLLEERTAQAKSSLPDEAEDRAGKSDPESRGSPVEHWLPGRQQTATDASAGDPDLNQSFPSLVPKQTGVHPA